MHVVKSSGNQKMVPGKLILLLLALQGRWEIKLMSSPAVQTTINNFSPSDLKDQRSVIMHSGKLGQNLWLAVAVRNCVHQPEITSQLK